MPLVVTGIAPTTDVGALEKALHNGGFSLDPLSVYVAGDAPEGHPDSGSRFVFSGNDSIRDILGRGSGGIYSSGAGNVPGLERTDGPEFFHEETVDERLSELAIPDSEVGNYEDAMDAGHAVVAYFARPETVEAVEGVFRAAGMANVRTY